MALPQSAVSELLEAFRAGDGVDLVRESVRLVMQELIEAEASEQIGADRYERTESRTAERNGAREGVSVGDPAEQTSGCPSRRRSGRRRGATSAQASTRSAPSRWVNSSSSSPCWRQPSGLACGLQERAPVHSQNISVGIWHANRVTVARTPSFKGGRTTHPA